MRLHEERLEKKTLNLMKNFTLVLISLLTSSLSIGQIVGDLSINIEVCDEASTVGITGPWWSWDPNGGAPATDNGDGTWTVVLPNMEADMEYLIVVDGVQENLIQVMADGGDCAPVTDYWSYANRKWLTTDTLEIDVTYGQCTACTTTNLSSASKIEGKFELFPNPASETLNVTTSGDFQRLNIVNIYGSVVKDVRLSSTNSVINLEDLSSGIYFVNAFSGENKITQQITIK